MRQAKRPIYIDHVFSVRQKTQLMEENFPSTSSSRAAEMRKKKRQKICKKLSANLMLYTVSQ